MGAVGKPSGTLNPAAGAVDYDTVATVGTGVELSRSFRAIHIVTAGVVTLRNSQGTDVVFGSLGAGTWPYGGNFIVAAPADAVLLY